MSVIRTLSASETNEQREKERAKLEKEYKKSDARLDELVEQHAQEIMEVMQVGDRTFTLFLWNNGQSRTDGSPNDHQYSPWTPAAPEELTGHSVV